MRSFSQLYMIVRALTNRPELCFDINKISANFNRKPYDFNELRLEHQNEEDFTSTASIIGTPSVTGTLDS